MLNLTKVNDIYFIGIGGIMMSALAKYFAAQGKAVAGSDRDKTEITQQLSNRLKVFYGHSAKHITKDYDLVIYTTAIDKNNEELSKAYKLGIPVLTVFEVLGMLSQNKKSIAISGMHGKSTTTAMIGRIFERAKLDPTVFIGSQVKEWQGNLRIGKSEYFISEACEYKDNFLNFYPWMGVVTNIEAEHLDYFKNLNGVLRSFKQFSTQIQQGGYLVFNADSRHAEKVANSYQGRKLSFGLEKQADFMAVDIQQSDKIYFTLKTARAWRAYDNQQIELQIAGKFNVYNALSAIASAALAGINVEAIQRALSSFESIWRRFEQRGIKSGLVFYDDYAHHPTEIKATLELAQQKFKGRNWWLVYQPHLYSRTYDFLDDFVTVLNKAPNLILAPIYPAREENKWDISSRDIVEKINVNYQRENKALFIGSHYESDKKDNYKKIRDYLKQNTNKGDVVITMGAGDVDLLIDEM